MSARGERLYRALLRLLLGGRARREIRADMAEVFRDLRRRARRGGAPGRWLFWPRVMLDLVWTAALERAVSGHENGEGTMTGRLRAIGQVARQSVRTLGRRRTRTAMTSLTVGLGVGAAVLAVVLARDVLLRPLPYLEADRLVRLRELDEDRRQWWPSVANFVDWRAAAPPSVAGIEAAGAPSTRPVLLDGRAVRASVSEYSAGLFGLLGATVVRGRAPTSAEGSPGGNPVAVVSHAFWQDAMGGGDLAGREVLVGTERFPVVGVLSPDFGFLGEGGAWDRPDLWLPLERRAEVGHRTNHGIHVVARLRPGAEPGAVSADLDRMARRVREAHREPTNAHAVRTTSLKADLLGGARRPVILLLVASLGVLMIAGANLVGTLLVDGLGRARELDVRRALGAGRSRLAGQLVLESAIAALPGAALGAALAWTGLEAARFLDPGALPRLEAVGLDGQVLGAGVLAAVGLAAASGLGAWLLVDRGGGFARMAAGGRAGPGRVVRRLWDGLIVLQVALTLVLVVGTGTLSRSLLAIVRQDLGFDPAGVVYLHASLPESRYADGAARVAWMEEALTRLRGVPGVAAASLTDVLPHETQARISGTTDPEVESEAWMFAGVRSVDSSYFDVLGIPLRAGSLPPAGDEGVAVVDAAVADRLFRGEALGHRVRSGLVGGVVEIRGVVGSVREWGMEPEEVGTIYLDFRSRPDPLGEVYLMARGPDGRAPDPAALRTVVAAVDPQVPLAVERLDAALGRTLGARRLLLALTGAFGFLGLVFAVTGIWGVVGYVARRSTREAGVRMALGARPGSVWRRTLAAGAWPVAVGLALGVAGMLVAFRAAAGLGQGTGAPDPAVVAAGVALLGAVSAAAATLPARRVTRVDLVEVLREE